MPSKKYLVVLLSVLLIYGCNGNNVEKSETAEENELEKLETTSNGQVSQPEIKSPTPTANPFESKKYPQPYCGVVPANWCR